MKITPVTAACETGTPIFPALESGQSQALADIAIQVYLNEVPPYAEAEMERLYQNVYASLAKLTIYGGIEGVSTFVVMQAGTVVTLWLYRHTGSTIVVLNELIEVTEMEVRRFADWQFKNQQAVHLILFRSIRPIFVKLPYPFQRHNYSEDIVVTLPETTEKYLQQLGKSTRKTIKGYSNKLLREFPTFKYQVLQREEASEAQIRAIIEMNRARMATKHKVADFDEAEIQRVLRMCRHFGLIGVATVDGHMCGGTITYHIGAHYFMQVSAHDAGFDNYRLGNLCCYLAVADCIARGGKEGHFLWGQYDFKYSLLGVRRDLDNLVIYRSTLVSLLHPQLVLRTIAVGHLRRAKIWLHEGVRSQRRTPCMLLELWQRIQAFKRRHVARKSD